MKKVLHRVNGAVSALEDMFAIALFYSLLGGVTVQVLARFVFHYPLPWSEELCRYFFVWLSAIGASIGVRWSVHFVAFDLQSLLSGWAQAVVVTIVKLGIGLVALVLLVEGVHLAVQGASQLTPILDVPMSWAFGAIPVSAALMLWHIAMGWIFGHARGGFKDLLGLEKGAE
jgi:C4-dicarboxylate transporter DctQ subunit